MTPLFDWLFEEHVLALLQRIRAADMVHFIRGAIADRIDGGGSRDVLEVSDRCPPILHDQPLGSHGLIILTHTGVGTSTTVPVAWRPPVFGFIRKGTRLPEL